MSKRVHGRSGSADDGEEQLRRFLQPSCRAQHPRLHRRFARPVTAVGIRFDDIGGDFAELVSKLHEEILELWICRVERHARGGVLCVVRIFARHDEASGESELAFELQDFTTLGMIEPAHQQDRTVNN